MSEVLGGERESRGEGEEVKDFKEWSGVCIPGFGCLIVSFFDSIADRNATTLKNAAPTCMPSFLRMTLHSRRKLQRSTLSGGSCFGAQRSRISSAIFSHSARCCLYVQSIITLNATCTAICKGCWKHEDLPLRVHERRGMTSLRVACCPLIATVQAVRRHSCTTCLRQH